LTVNEGPNKGRLDLRVISIVFEVFSSFSINIVIPWCSYLLKEVSFSNFGTTPDQRRLKLPTHPPQEI
jgi:hypothetical protein